MIQEETAAKVKEIEAECEAKKNPSMLSQAMALGRRLLALVSGGEEPAGDDLSGKLREAERSWNSAESRLWQMKEKAEEKASEADVRLKDVSSKFDHTSKQLQRGVRDMDHWQVELYTAEKSVELYT